MSKIKVGISIGDPNGIGLEIIMKTFKDSRILDFCTPIVFGCSKATAIHRKILNMQDFNFNVISKVSDANAKRTNLINIRNKDIDIKLGETTKECGQLAHNSIKEACKASCICFSSEDLELLLDFLALLCSIRALRLASFFIALSPRVDL